MMKNKVLALMLTIVMVLSLASCSASGGSAQSEASASVAPHASSQKTDAAKEASTEAKDLSFDIVDSVGRTVHFEKPAETCCTGYQGGSFFTMCALFGEKVADHLACWDGLLNTWPDFYEAFCEAIPGLKTVPVVGNFKPDTLNVEKVIASHPDVVILPYYYYTVSGIPDKVVPQLEAAGIPVVVTNYRQDKLEDHMKSMQIIGKVFGKEERAKELADFYKDQVNIVYSKVDKLMKQGTKPPVFYIEFGNKGAAEFGLSYSNSSQWGNIVTSVGGTTLYADGTTDYPVVDPEFILKSDPDCILILGEIWGKPGSTMSLGTGITEKVASDGLAAYCTRPGWNNLKAVKEKKVYAICNSLTHDIFSFYCFQQMAKIVWPDEFSDLNPDATLKEFFDRFMPVKYSGVWFYSMK
jgi:iron complex transport system substrate-binding protein